jgi:hypothetical protein
MEVMPSAVGGSEYHDLRGLRNRVSGLGRIRQRGTKEHQNFVLEDQFLEDVDRLLFLALLVFEHQRELVALHTASSVDLFEGEYEAVLD